LAFDFDVSVAMIGSRLEKEAMDKEREKSEEQHGAGQGRQQMKPRGGKIFDNPPAVTPEHELKRLRGQFAAVKNMQNKAAKGRL